MSLVYIIVYNVVEFMHGIGWRVDAGFNYRIGALALDVGTMFILFTYRTNHISGQLINQGSNTWLWSCTTSLTPIIMTWIMDCSFPLLLVLQKASSHHQLSG